MRFRGLVTLSKRSKWIFGKMCCIRLTHEATSRFNMKRKDQQDATIRCLLLTSVSTCFGHHYAHLQENKDPVTAFGVLFWFCWMWLIAVDGRCLAGCEHYEGFCSTETFIVLTPCKTAPPQPLPTTSGRTRTTLD